MRVIREENEMLQKTLLAKPLREGRILAYVGGLQ
jgi:hypothetical protein